MMNRKTTRIVTRNRKRWLDQAIKNLLEEGPQAVSVNRIARQLRTSRSPFFHAFGSRKEFLRAMFDFYQQETTIKVRESVERFNGSPIERFWYFWFCIIEYQLFRYDYPFRQWSLMDPLIGKLIQKMDQNRMDFTRKLYLDMGYSEEEADHRASFNYHEYIGILVMGRPEISPEWLKRRAKFRFYMHTTAPMPEDFKLPLLKSTHAENEK